MIWSTNLHCQSSLLNFLSFQFLNGLRGMPLQTEISIFKIDKLILNIVVQKCFLGSQFLQLSWQKILRRENSKKVFNFHANYSFRNYVKMERSDNFAKFRQDSSNYLDIPARILYQDLISDDSSFERSQNLLNITPDNLLFLFFDEIFKKF